MSAIDPEYTLGRLASDRERLLQALAAEGLLGRNARSSAPGAPARVGLVTSSGQRGGGRLPPRAGSERAGLAGHGPRHPGPGQRLGSRRGRRPAPAGRPRARRHRRHPRWWGPHRPGHLRQRSRGPGHRRPPPAGADRHRPRGRPQRGRRGRPHVVQDAHRLRRVPRRPGQEPSTTASTSCWAEIARAARRRLDRADRHLQASAAGVARSGQAAVLAGDLRLGESARRLARAAPRAIDRATVHLEATASPRRRARSRPGAGPGLVDHPHRDRRARAQRRRAAARRPARDHVRRRLHPQPGRG